MPITQSRMLAICDESLGLFQRLLQFRVDLYAALESNVPNARKLDVIRHLLDVASDAAGVPEAAREREHFRRTQRSNANAAKRMRKSRSQTTQREHEHGMD